MTKISRALVSVSNKKGIVELCQALTQAGVEVISSGGTRKVLTAAGIVVTPIEEVTGNPEAFGGRMKTLSFQISSSLLFRRGHSDDEVQAKSLGIRAIDLVICNLYPFSEVVKKGGAEEELVENIDIGGPTMVRAAAKNYNAVTVLTSPKQYESFLESFKVGDGVVPIDIRKMFSLEAFRHTASYDALISETFEKMLLGESRSFHGSLEGEEATKVRYGENPHQRGYVVANPIMAGSRTLANTPCLQGKALSYNNYLDADAAWRSMSDLARINPELNTVTIIKHSNPCGAAISSSNSKALELAWSGDPISAFGSIIAFSHEVDGEEASFICERFVEVVIAPSFTSSARDLFSKKKNLRLLELAPQKNDFEDKMIRTIHGGYLVQDEDNGSEEKIESVCSGNSKVSSKLIKFGILVTKHLKSNAISLCLEKEGSFLLAGGGMGNPNRLVSLDQAYQKAKENGYNDFDQMVLISDAFFPFRDNIDKANAFGIKTIVQPGGSIKDKEVISACEEFGINMYFTGMRHFRH